MWSTPTYLHHASHALHAYVWPSWPCANVHDHWEFESLRVWSCRLRSLFDSSCSCSIRSSASPEGPASCYARLLWSCGINRCRLCSLFISICSSSSSASPGGTALVHWSEFQGCKILHCRALAANTTHWPSPCCKYNSLAGRKVMWTFLSVTGSGTVHTYRYIRTYIIHPSSTRLLFLALHTLTPWKVHTQTVKVEAIQTTPPVQSANDHAMVQG